MKLEPRGIIRDRQLSTGNGCAARIGDGAFQGALVSLAPGGRNRKKNSQQKKRGHGAPARHHPMQTARQNSNSFPIHGIFSPSSLEAIANATTAERKPSRVEWRAPLIWERMQWAQAPTPDRATHTQIHALSSIT